MSDPLHTQLCEKLGIEVAQGIDDKLPYLKQWAAQQDVELDKLIYVGNDLNDVDCLHAVGCGIAVADAYPAAKTAANIILAAGGGRGAVREVVELVAQLGKPNP